MDDATQSWEAWRIAVLKQQTEHGEELRGMRRDMTMQMSRLKSLEDEREDRHKKSNFWTKFLLAVLTGILFPIAVFSIQQIMSWVAK